MFRASRFPLLIGAAALTLAAISTRAGIDLMGSALGVYAVAGAIIVSRNPASHGHSQFGAANTVTLARLIGTCLFAGLAISLMDGMTLTPFMAATVLVCGVGLLLADGIDGWLARRTRMSSAFGARFDMEVDALLILVLSVIAWQSGKAGPWILFSGAARYMYVAAGVVWRALRTPLFASTRRKTIAAIQGSILVALLAPGIISPVSDALGLCGVLLLLYSFGMDIVWQINARPGQTLSPAGFRAGE